MALRFDQLVTALATAVVEAQHRVQQAQIGEIWNYFKEGSPISVELQIPRVSLQTAQQEPVKVSIPLITLVNQSQVSIQEMQITMQVDMSEIAGTSSTDPPKLPLETSPPHEWKAPEYETRMAGSTTSPKPLSQIGIAQITLTIKAEETSEGLARLLDHLNKSL